MKGTTLGTNPAFPLFEDEPGPGLEPVGGEFQPPFETGYTDGGAHLIVELKVRKQSIYINPKPSSNQ